MKKCTKCGEIKEFGEFHKDKSKKDGLRSGCKSCKKEYNQNNREARLAQKREYDAKAETKEKRNKRQRDRRKNDPLWRKQKDFSTAFWKQLQKQDKIKINGTFQDLDILKDDFDKHLKQFRGIKL